MLSGGGGFIRFMFGGTGHKDQAVLVPGVVLQSWLGGGAPAPRPPGEADVCSVNPPNTEPPPGSIFGRNFKTPGWVVQLWGGLVRNFIDLKVVVTQAYFTLNDLVGVHFGHTYFISCLKSVQKGKFSKKKRD